MSQLTVFEAINEMRELSSKDVPFSFSFMSYDRTAQQSHGIVEVRRARLKRRTKEADYQNTEMIEEYTDLDIMEPRRFYHPTLMTFNGHRVTLL